MRLQIAITAICSLEICQLALNVSVKDKNIQIFHHFSNVTPISPITTSFDNVRSVTGV